MKKSVIFSLGLTLLLGLGSCTHQAWEEHYNANTVNVIDKTLKEAILEDASLSSFAAFLQECDYLDMFGNNQSYTIWAPTNQAWEGFDASDKQNLLLTLKNHVSRYPYLTTDVDNQEVTLRMMDNKSLRFYRDGEDYYFGSQKLVTKDQVYKNGILHKMDSYEPFVMNIYEYIQYTPGIDSLNAFLQANHVKQFNESQSLILGVNDMGETVYDSVFIEYNVLLSLMGDINSEDASYTALLPSNTAWADYMTRIRPYYNYHPFVLPLPASGEPETDEQLSDSLEVARIRTYLLKHLVFNGALTPEKIKTLTSMETTYPGLPVEIEDMPAYFAGALDSYTVLSNGVVYTTDHVNMDEKFWCKTKKIEAENFNNHYSIPNSFIGSPDTLSLSLQESESATRSLNARSSYKSSLNDSISQNAYLEVTGNPTKAPVIAFDLTGMAMSGVDYNVKVVFLPENLYNPKKAVLPLTMNFSISYLNSDGDISTTNYRAAKYTNPSKIDTVTVTTDDAGNPKPIRFPYSDGLISLKVNSLIEAGQDTTYARDMLIDCIILEPDLK